MAADEPVCAYSKQFRANLCKCGARHAGGRLALGDTRRPCKGKARDDNRGDLRTAACFATSAARTADSARHDRDAPERGRGSASLNG